MPIYWSNGQRFCYSTTHADWNPPMIESTQKQIGPLEGIRILDAASMLACPTAASLLSEYGADVIKIEQPKTGDPMRTVPPFRGDVSLWWKVVGRNKKSVTLDLRQESGRAVLRELAGKCDVVLLNYRPETLTKWGLDFDDLVKCKSDIVVLHLTAFGRTGPYANRPGFARVAEAFAGLTHRTGFPGQEPVQSGYPMLGDSVAGLYGAFALMLALRQRDRTGQPQFVDLGLYEPLLQIIEDQIPAYGDNGAVMDRIGNSNPFISPNGLFPTKDGRYVSIPASTQPIWRRLVAVMGDDTLLAYDSNPKRIANRDMIEGKVANWTSSHNLVDLLALCGEEGIPCGPVYSTAEIVKDPHIAARGSIIAVDDPETGRPVSMPASAGRFSGFTGHVRNVGPQLGEHTNQVLTEVLGYSDERIESLRTDGTV
jgi:crotonobetainyl-CoA:carnitine CoA-transferase CaiB-like acyl-CoA transferase